MGAERPPIWLAPNDRFPPNSVIRTLRPSAGNQKLQIITGSGRWCDRQLGKNTLTFLLTHALTHPVTAPANLAEPAQPPDPHPDRAAVTPTYTTRLLGFVRKLIGFGHEIAAAVQQRPTGDALFPIAFRFGTKSIALMLASIARGLRLAAELEERLGGQPARLNPARATARALSPCRPRAPRAAPPSQGSVPTGLPTSKEIAAWFRESPVETVLLHICSRLGLTRSDPLWRELDDLLIERFAGVIQKVEEILKRERTVPAKSLPPDRPLTPPTPLRQPARHVVSAATSGADPPLQAA